MIITPRMSMALVVLALAMAVLACGCTSSGSSTAVETANADSSGYTSTFTEVAGTYTSVDNPSLYITLMPDGAAELNTGDGKIQTSIYMEMGVLYLADGTPIGAYPVQDGTLTCKGMTFKK
jgi:hypothetical protein